MSYCDLCLKIHQIVEALPLFNYTTPLSRLPENGIYFFYEAGEWYEKNSVRKERIVRVGTHKEQGNFRKRIYTHYKGNKNASVFRKHLGGALIASVDPNDPRLLKWLKQDTKDIAFKEIEERVTKRLQELFRFRCIEVNDRSERLDLEERLIAALSNCPYCRPSTNWLGKFAVNEDIRWSGLWNTQHVRSNRKLTDEHLSKLAELVNRD